MATNNQQTIAQIPVDLTDVTSFKRFLNTLVENLDTVLGFKGATNYVKTSDEDFSITDLAGQLRELSTKLDELKKTTEEKNTAVDDVQQATNGLTYVTETQVTGSSYYDFNASLWADLRGKLEFTADGASIVNPPIAVTGTTTVLADSVKTSDSVWQTVLVKTNGNSLSAWTRLGVNSDWLRLG